MRSYALAALSVMLFAGCATRLHTRTGADVAVDRALGQGVVPRRLIVEPAAGVRPLTRLIDKAQRTIFAEVYILTDGRVAHALERAASQGVSVRVVLERHPFGMAQQPDRMAALLRAGGVVVRWARPDVALTHSKFLVLDDRIAVIGTANLSRSAFSANREFLVVDTDRADVHESSNLFRADWNRIPATLGDHDLVVAPSNARVKISALISQARRRISVYGEEVADRRTERLLIDAARRGVRVRLLLPPLANPGDVARLRRGGVHVREPAAPYIHAKAIIIDGREAYVGSVNLSTQSLDRNRELGVLVRGASVPILQRVFDRDWGRR